MDIFISILQMFLVLPIILILIYISIKVGGSKLDTLNKNRYIKIIERVPLNKENSIFLIKLGQEYYVAASNNGSFEIIKELSKDEVIKLEENKEIPQYDSFKDFICDIKSKFRKNEEKKWRKDI